MAQRNAADHQKITALEQALAGSMQQHLAREQQFAQTKQIGTQPPPAQLQPVQVQPAQPIQAQSS